MFHEFRGSVCSTLREIERYAVTLSENEYISTQDEHYLPRYGVSLQDHRKLGLEVNFNFDTFLQPASIPSIELQKSKKKESTTLMRRGVDWNIFYRCAALKYDGTNTFASKIRWPASRRPAYGAIDECESMELNQKKTTQDHT